MFGFLSKRATSKSNTTFSANEIRAAKMYTDWLIFLEVKRRELIGKTNITQAPPAQPIPTEPSRADILPAWDKTDPASSDNLQESIQNNIETSHAELTTTEADSSLQILSHPPLTIIDPHKGIESAFDN